MGNWSINPNTLASIDDNGKATFQEHTQDTNYTITYNNGTSGNITKTFTVYACSQPPVDCSKYEFSNVGGEVSSSGGVVSMGYSSTAEADLSFSSEKSDSWITLSHIQRGRVYKAYMCTIAANNTGAERTGYAVFTSTDGCEFSGTVTQKAVEWVDLGLPSGTKWATHNVGATAVSDDGNYYQYGKGSRQYSQTCSEPDYKGTENPLSLSLDAARQTWGSPWHMPTVSQFEELKNNTTKSTVTIGPRKCLKLKSNKNNNYLIIPYAGAAVYKHTPITPDGINEYFYLLGSSSNSEDENINLYGESVYPENTDWEYNSRDFGMSVRPVSGTTDVHTYEFSASTQAQEGENKDKITVQSSGEGGGGVIVWSKRDGEDIPFTVVTSKPSEIWTSEIQAPSSMHPYQYLWQYATKDASVGITITFTQNGSGNIITATTRHNYHPGPGPGPSPSSGESVKVTIHNNVNGAAINTVGIIGRNTCVEDGWTSDIGFSVGGGAISYGGSKTNTVILPSDWSTINYYMLRGTYNGGSSYSAINTSCGGHTFSLSVTRNASSKTMDIYLIGNA